MPLEKYTICRDDNVYEAFPDVAMTSSGKLICVFLECKHHGDRSYTRIMMCESFDRGRTWTAKKPLTQASTSLDLWWNCPRIQQLQDGRMLVVVDRVSGLELTGTNYVVYYLGDSDGNVWSEAIETPCEGIVPDKICETPSGRWVLSAHYRNPQTQNLAQRLWYSDDKGISWIGPVTVASKKGLDLCEISILCVGDKLVGLLRENTCIGLDCYKVISEDDGLSWSEPVTFPLPGCHRPVAGYLNDGRVMISYRFLQGGNGWLGRWTQNFFVAVTDTQSMLAQNRQKAWSRIRPVDFDRSNESDTGYSGWVQFGDDEVYIVNYIVDNAPKAQIRGYSLRPSEFFDPPIESSHSSETLDSLNAVLVK